MKIILVDLGGTLVLNRGGHAILNQQLFGILERSKDQFGLVVLSDTTYDVSSVLENFGIMKTFHPMIITKHLFAIDKTDSVTYLFACEKAGAQPGDCLLIDNEPNFARAAKQAGIATLSPNDPLFEINFSKFCSGEKFDLLAG